MYDSSNFQRSTRSPFRSMARYFCHVFISELGSLPCTSCLRTCSVALVRRNPKGFPTALQLQCLDVFGFLTEGLERKDDPVKCSYSLLHNIHSLRQEVFDGVCHVLICFAVFPTEQVSVCNTKWIHVYSMSPTMVDLSFSQATKNLTKMPCTVGTFTRCFMLPKFTS